ncbi:MAG: class I SAM-dependent methyltransferase [Planctomycetes bacterium]|nr:class I SAM-dependent methyltransferase [Planctomycetota bacterium]
MIIVDTEKGRVVVSEQGKETTYDIGDPRAFSLLSSIWLRSGWDAKYVYSFTWMGRPVIQLPEDLIRIQEVIHAVKPDVIVETGVAHGGSLVFYATLCKAMEKGRVIGVDVEIRPHNRRAIETHPFFALITLIEGSSIDPAVVAKVKALVRPGEQVLVILDACHTKQHVLAELEAYAPLVGVGSYLVAADGIMEQVAGAPRTQPDWTWNNPRQAALEFVSKNPAFAIVEPGFPFNEGSIVERVTYWPGGFIKRIA